MLDKNETPSHSRGIDHPRETLLDLHVIRELSYQKFPDATNKSNPGYSHEEALEEYLNADVEVSRARIEVAQESAKVAGASHAEPENYLNDVRRRFDQVRQELHALINYAYHVDGVSLKELANTLGADPDTVREIVIAQTHVGPVLKAQSLIADE